MLSDSSNVEMYRRKFAKKMSEVAGAIRSSEGIHKLSVDVDLILWSFAQNVRVSSESELYKAYRLKDILVSQRIYLCAMENYILDGGASRGSAIYLDSVSDFASLFDFEFANEALLTKVQEISHDGHGANIEWRDVRPLPDGGGVFENVWREYREKKIFE